MSLNIYFDGQDCIPKLDVKFNIEDSFMYVELDGCDYDKAILENIEQGIFVDNNDFVDRFGRTLPCSFLSTGTKGAMLLYHNPDSLIWGIELGRNALCEIVRYCRNGNLLLPAQNYYLACDDKDYVIDVVCSGKHYTSFNEFAVYMMDGAPYGVVDTE